MTVKAWGEIYAKPKNAEDMFRWAASHAPLMARLFGHSRILEVGTGTGMLAALLARQGDLTATLDNDSQVQTTARAFFTSVRADVRVVEGDAFHMPFADQEFDASFSQGLLEHFSDEEMRRIIKEQLRVAQNVYASVPSCFYPHIGHLGPGLIGNERLLTLGHYRRILSQFAVDGQYYADFKQATFAGWTIPWPNQILLQVRLRS